MFAMSSARQSAGANVAFPPAETEKHRLEHNFEYRARAERECLESQLYAGPHSVGLSNEVEIPAAMILQPYVIIRVFEDALPELAS